MNDPLVEIAAKLLGTTPDKVEAVEITIEPENFVQVSDPPKPFVDFVPGPQYLLWLNEVSALLNIDVEELKKDDCWYWCFDDGYSPQRAVDKYKKSLI